MKISIITTTYNSASTVEDTFRSLLRQGYQDIEYIVVDGCSTDGTIDIIKRYEPQFEGKMKWISEKDEGIYDAMNKGFAMATGDVIGILNSDDFYTADDILNKVADTMSKDDSLDAVYGDIHYVHPDDLQKSIRYYSSKPFCRIWMRFGFMPAHPAFYCKRAIYEKYGAFDLEFPVSADFENLLRLIFVHKIKTKYIEADFVTMRTGGMSSSGLRSLKAGLRDRSKALKKNNVYSNKLFLFSLYIYKYVKMQLHKWQN